ncbi:hypothetical protein LEP1GSC021_3275 [Leptospira noguchii str. 1993005606]|nr:hypothetical protein LEP1GSC021_3275 [Leptospira noguchii str. 1993005606]
MGTITNLNLNFTNRLGPQPITILWTNVGTITFRKFFLS